jgi:hypothetical protein
LEQDQLEQEQAEDRADDEELEDEDLEDGTGDEEEDEDEDDADAALEEEDGDQASLDELLAQRAAGRRGSDDADDNDDIMALSSEPAEPPTGEPIPTRVAPVKDSEEFVCKSCHLVKPKVQLADPKRGYCRDCV